MSVATLHLGLVSLVGERRELPRRSLTCPDKWNEDGADLANCRDGLVERTSLHESFVGRITRKTRIWLGVGLASRRDSCLLLGGRRRQTPSTDVPDIATDTGRAYGHRRRNGHGSSGPERRLELADERDGGAVNAQIGDTVGEIRSWRAWP